jgi:hypothetical protein
MHSCTQPVSGATTRTPWNAPAARSVKGVFPAGVCAHKNLPLFATNKIFKPRENFDLPYCRTHTLMGLSALLRSLVLQPHTHMLMMFTNCYLRWALQPRQARGEGRSGVDDQGHRDQVPAPHLHPGRPPGIMWGEGLSHCPKSMCEDSSDSWRIDIAVMDAALGVCAMSELAPLRA